MSRDDVVLVMLNMAQRRQKFISSGVLLCWAHCGVTHGAQLSRPYLQRQRCQDLTEECANQQGSKWRHT